MAQRYLLSNIRQSIKFLPATWPTTLNNDNDNRKTYLLGKDGDYQSTLQSSPCALTSPFIQNSANVRSIYAVFNEQLQRREDVYAFTFELDNLDQALLPPKPTTKCVVVDKFVQTDDDDPTIDNCNNLPNKSAQFHFIQFLSEFENDCGVDSAERGEHSRAESLLRQAASRGSLNALYNLGNYFSLKECDRHGLDKAARYWKQAATKGHALSKYQLATCHISGLLAASSLSYGQSLMEQSADAGCPQAQLYMAIKLLKGSGELSNAEKYLKEAILDLDIKAEVQTWLIMRSCPQAVKDLVNRLMLLSAD